jgi:hypothetical protein
MKCFLYSFWSAALILGVVGTETAFAAPRVTNNGAALIVTSNPDSFPDTALGQSSSITVNISPKPGEPPTINSVNISGTNSSDFRPVDQCSGHTLHTNFIANQLVTDSCKIIVTFIPTAIGPRSANLEIISTSAFSPSNVPLNGNGILNLIPPGGLSISRCGDGICNSVAGETIVTCPRDCSQTNPPNLPQNPGGGACVPTTCDAQGKNCGSISDGCGATLACGTCNGSQVCTDNVCVACVPTTCEAQEKNCGTIDNGCGMALNCGTCSGSQVCTDNVCQESTPVAAASTGGGGGGCHLNARTGSAKPFVWGAMGLLWIGIITQRVRKKNIASYSKNSSFLKKEGL